MRSLDSQWFRRVSKKFGVWPLPSRLHLTTYLALAVLIFGNALGWAHVGCHASGHACRHASIASTASAVAAETEHVCCQHAHNPFKHRTSCQQQQQNQPKSLPHRERQPAGGEHDSDSCFVCQSVFALRQGLIADSVTFVWEPGIAHLQPACVSSVLPEAVFLSGLSVRGPPQA